MCRMVAWQGKSRPLAHLICSDYEGLQSQALCSRKAKVDQHGDGNGVVWYSPALQRTVYRSTRCAWDDHSLDQIVGSQSSCLFLAHARAATSGSVCESNCHPFVADGWSFMHNGQIAKFADLREQLFALLPEERALAHDATDSEFLFQLALHFGLGTEVGNAWISTFAAVEKVAMALGLPCLIRCSALFTNGETTYALRYSSDEKAPSLFLQNHDQEGAAIASEPVVNAKLAGNWKSLPANSLTTLSFESCHTELLSKRCIA